MGISHIVGNRNWLSQRNFVNPALMPTAFERGVQKGFDRMSGFLLTDKSAGHYEYVGIIVLACETCYLFLPAQSGPYSLMFIECHGYSVSGSADGYSGIYFAGFYSFGKRMGVVGIITTFCRVGSEIFIGQPFRVEYLFYEFFQFVPCVVTT